MYNFKIEFANPWLLLTLIPIVALTVILYLRLNKKYRRTRNRITSIVLHMIVSVLCVCVLAGITFSYQTPNLENEILLLVDASHSSKETQDKKNEFIQSVILRSGTRFKLGIVTFAYGQSYVSPLSNDTTNLYTNYIESLKSEELDDSATDIASALTYAKTLFQKPSSAKIVLVTDGIETDGSAMKVIKAIAADGIKVDTVHFPNETATSEVQMINAELPDYSINVGDEFTATVTVQSTYTGEARVTMYDKDISGTTTASEPVKVSLTAGVQVPVEITHAFSLPDMHEIYFEITTADGKDLMPENNVFHTYFFLQVFDNILIVERSDKESEQLESLLSKDLNGEFTVKVVNINDAEMMPQTLDELRVYDQIILVNIANADMPEGFAEKLHSYVYDIGGGLFTVGGSRIDEEGKEVANAYNREDMYGTLYQQMLPVQAINYTPPLGVMIIIDRSGSMEEVDYSTGKTKLDLAKDGAKACLNAMSDRDWCGVMTLEEKYKEEVEMTPVTKVSSIITAIDKIKGGGGTVFSGALERAGLALKSLTTVEKRHIILVTDGQPSDDLVQYGKIIEHYYETANITFSIVSIGVNAGASANMKYAAEELGHGYFYDVWDGSTLPGIMREDLNVPEIEEYKPEVFTPRITAHTAVINGINEAEMPQLGGFYGTKIKDGADAVISGEYVPIYAQWKYGKGTVGSFMCDLNGTWSNEFIVSDTGIRLINNIVGNLFPTEDIDPREIDVELNEDNYTTEMNIFTTMEEGQFIEVVITSPPSEDDSVSSVQTLYPSADDGYGKISFTLMQPGVHEIVVRKIDEETQKVIAEYVTYKTFSYSEEYNVFVDEKACALFLETLAESGRGQVIKETWQIFDNFEVMSTITIDPRLAFIIISLVLFLLDVAVRKFKFKWPHEIIRDYRAQKKLKEQAEKH